MGDDGRQRPGRGRGGIGSTLLMAAAALVLLGVGFVYLRDRNDTDPTPPPPTSPPGHNEMRDIVQALRDQGLEVNYGQRGLTSALLSVPGQPLTVDGAPLYVFVYREVAKREQESAGADPAEILRPRSGPGPGTPVPPGEPHLAAGSNVLVVLNGGDDETAAKVERAIAGLP